MKYLVIVESPAKKIKISEYLNTINAHNFIVDASFGHVRYFKNGLKSIDFNNNYNPTYDVMSKSKKVISNLKKLKNKVDEVIIATDLDREGEAIGFHLIKSLGLDLKNTKRIVFNEITKNAIINAFHNQGILDMNLFYAQQARSIIDLLIGFKISPVIWKNIAYNLSAGRCQSPALKIIYDRELEIEKFKSEKSFKLESKFKKLNNIIFKYYKNVVNRDILINLLNTISMLSFFIDRIKISKSTQKPPPPYITSTIQQDASCNLGLSPKQTMITLQKLYEKGKITYMRTDSFNISNDFQKKIKKYVDQKYKGFYKKNVFSKKKNTQEAHECIRPTKIDYNHISSNEKENRLYQMIKNRVIASQMKNAIINNHKYYVKDKETGSHEFTSSIPEILDLGFKIIYNSNNDETNIKLIKKLKKNDILEINLLEASENNSKPPPRYTEASLIKELVNLGIGRPSTFSNIVSKNFERKYLEKLNSKNISQIEIFEIKPGGKLKNKLKEVTQVIKNKIGITNLGKKVIQFLVDNFNDLISFDYTSKIESDLDRIADNKKIWHKIVDKVNKKIDSEIKNVNINVKPLEVLKQKIGINPKNKKNIYFFMSKKGNYIVQEGEDNEKPLFKYTNNEKITLKEALDLFKYPRLLGKLNKKDIEINFGRYGYYISHGKRNMSIDNENITFEDAKKMLTKTYYKEYSDFIVLEGKYGIYIKKGKRNIPIPKDLKDKVKTLKKKDFEKIISEYKGRKYYPKKKK